MNFLEKIEMESENGVLSFLKDYGFDPDETCGYGCCKGFYRGFYSSDGSFYNRLTLSIKGGKVKAVNHKDYDYGGNASYLRNSIDLKTATEETVLEMIKDVLPDDLD